MGVYAGGSDLAPLRASPMKPNLRTSSSDALGLFLPTPRRKDVDQIQDELEVEKLRGKATTFEVDDDLPGQGQFYCTPCARHFTDAETRRLHVRSKPHKRR